MSQSGSRKIFVISENAVSLANSFQAGSHPSLLEQDLSKEESPPAKYESKMVWKHTPTKFRTHSVPVTFLKCTYAHASET